MMTAEQNISVEYLRTRLRYEPETGKLFWLDSDDMPKSVNARLAGKEAFTAYINGYKHGRVLGKLFRTHRVIWALHYGEWPNGHIDHINGVKDDNRISNLRVVSHQENQRNQKKRSDNTSGVTGVTWYKPTGKWRAEIGLDGKSKSIGYFEDFEEAVAARKSAEEKYGFHENHGRR